MSKYQQYTKEFKLEAVRLLEHGDQSVTELALRLGIRRNLLYKWQAQLRGKGDAAFGGPGRQPASEDSEVACLKRELARVTEARDMLKKRDVVLPVPRGLAWVGHQLLWEGSSTCQPMS